MLCSPCLLVVQALGAEVGRVVGFGLHPDNHVSVIASRGEKLSCRKGLAKYLNDSNLRMRLLTFGGPSDNIDSLRVFAQGGKVINVSSFLAIVFDFPKLFLG